MTQQSDIPGIDRVPVGIIGGSGLYEIEGFEVLHELDVDTPYGAPSAKVLLGNLEGVRVAFLPRHGKNHEFSPSSVPYRANIWAMKRLGVFWLMTVNAVGSLKEEIAPGHFVIPDQIIDKTTKRPNTMYDEFVAHASLSHPFHPMLREVLLEATRACGVTVHDGGTYVAMEGPAFSTIAESNLHRQWGAELIGMTAMPEARLAREAEICYAGVCLATDYDVWREGEDEVDVTGVLEVLKQNVTNAKRVLKAAVGKIPFGREEECDASRALQYAIVTKPGAISELVRQRYALVLDKYL
ncbi:MAG: S-methyl-5'-thioadenosine phosphorylase [Myxococcota bacterium]